MRIQPWKWEKRGSFGILSSSKQAASFHHVEAPLNINSCRSDRCGHKLAGLEHD